ncbi:MAG: methyltransferase domain-containing protein [Phenylobacterium sp.]|uniref:methyltransferase domain-containing protein n=1 Tax=Phenylobacterium sp. TaxID=1871053 RepID=UPI0027269583|nr:methyltransferase domain-containing protein [Phenylobacterium sp.]MDO8900818.1 methyltransferase domain-containing protein [Phenylobacterium sp.]
MIAPDASQVSDLHRERLETVVQLLLAHGVRTVCDLGCGSGALLERLVAEPQFETVIGLEQSYSALEHLRGRLGSASTGARVRLAHGSFTEADPRLAGLDAAVMMETLEHVEPDLLSQVERAVFAVAHPGLVIITTPNVESNPLLGLRPGRFRHPDHRFEWSRARFAGWAEGVAQRNGYAVTLGGIGWSHPRFGAPTQMASFVRKPGTERKV